MSARFFRRSRRAAAIPVGMAVATALAFLPTSAGAAQLDDGAGAARSAAAKTAAEAGDSMSYVVNTRSGHGSSRDVQQAVVKAGGSVVIA
ncbi:hypothetical protein [Streptomyces sp. H27-D2]|uniref:hypothetical protein n=1 Tax=Streptomyces sp. H27-D2 TaxID=3046304 RepID=UPI002DBD8C73|nr:hypothetical protein [Streptomyces sp. H27-D2]MEC4017730.1 hypothetical protein [Streptomyces sp. H27-D2]